MAIRKREYKNKKGGKKVLYYAVVSHPTLERPLWSIGYATRKEAKEKENELFSSINSRDSKKYEVGKKHSFLEVAMEWLENSRSDYANATYKNYEYYLRYYLTPYLKDVMIDEIDEYFIEKIKNGISRRCGAEVVNKCLNVLSNVFKYAIGCKLVRRNPVLGIKRKKVVLKEIVTWSKEDIRNFLDSKIVRESEIYDMLLISFIGGLRPSEVCGLSARNVVDMGITLTDGLDKYGVRTKLKTERSRRSYGLPDALMKRLIDRTKGKCSEEFLFINSIGNPFTPDLYSKFFKTLLKEYNKQEGIEPLLDVSFYTACRHGFGTNLVVYDEVSLSVVAKLMGNSEETLRKRYVHVADSVQKNVLQNYVSHICKDA